MNSDNTVHASNTLIKHTSVRFNRDRCNPNDLRPSKNHIYHFQSKHHWILNIGSGVDWKYLSFLNPCTTNYPFGKKTIFTEVLRFAQNFNIGSISAINQHKHWRDLIITFPTSRFLTLQRDKSFLRAASKLEQSYCNISVRFKPYSNLSTTKWVEALSLKCYFLCLRYSPLWWQTKSLDSSKHFL